MNQEAIIPWGLWQSRSTDQRACAGQPPTVPSAANQLPVASQQICQANKRTVVNPWPYSVVSSSTDYDLCFPTSQVQASTTLRQAPFSSTSRRYFYD